MTPGERDEHHLLEQAFAQYPGMWVAIDSRTGDVRASASTPEEVAARIRKENMRGVTMLRVPAADEPEVVGFG